MPITFIYLLQLKVLEKTLTIYSLNIYYHCTLGYNFYQLKLLFKRNLKKAHFSQFLKWLLERYLYLFKLLLFLELWLNCNPPPFIKRVVWFFEICPKRGVSDFSCVDKKGGLYWKRGYHLFPYELTLSNDIFLWVSGVLVYVLFICTISISILLCFMERT